jgi:hypothetical protein
MTRTDNKATSASLAVMLPRIESRIVLLRG